MDIARFKKLPIMGIARGIKTEDVAPLVDAVMAGGLETLEITMNTQNAQALITQTVEASGNRLMVGAGTVLNLDSLKIALDAGATFIVTPVVVDEVMEYCTKNVIPVFPGALTPGEIYRAWSLGATMVKVFPAKFFGPEYFNEIKGPFADIELLACGGVTSENLPSYFSNGADAVSFGGSILRKDWLANKEFGLITDGVRKLIGSFKKNGIK